MRNVSWRDTRGQGGHTNEADKPWNTTIINEGFHHRHSFILQSRAAPKRPFFWPKITLRLIGAVGDVIGSTLEFQG